ncbi:gustatory receptor for sugar taste 43a-like isoform X2 [Prorops nasuta]
MNKKPVKSDLFQALFPIYYLCKAWGLLPVKFTEESPGRYVGELQIIFVIYNLLLVFFLLGAEVWGLYRDLKDGWASSTRFKNATAVIVTCSDVLSVISLMGISILGSPFRWKYLQPVADKLVQVDEKLGLVTPKRTRRFSIVLTAATLIYLLFISSLDIYVWDRTSKINKKMIDKGPINYCPLYLMYVVIIIMEIQYAVSTYNIGQRFLRLNKSLENILRTGSITDYFRKDLGLAGDLREGHLTTYTISDPGTLKAIKKLKVFSWDSAENDKKSMADSISELITVHANLCDTVTFSNHAFGLAMLAATLTCLLHLIITPYILITEFLDKREGLFLLAQSTWIIFHTMRLIIIVQPTYNTVTKAKRTAILVSQLLSSSPDAEAQKQLEIFSLQLLQRPLEFSACGLFSLDRPLVTSIAGAVTTYLVILIQFQKADDTKCEIDKLDNIFKNASQILKNASSLNNFTILKLNDRN